MPEKTLKYSREDFQIQRIQTRHYSNEFDSQTLIYANIKNLKTNTEIQDWVRPDQLMSLEKLNHLIKWEA